MVVSSSSTANRPSSSSKASSSKGLGSNFHSKEWTDEEHARLVRLLGVDGKKRKGTWRELAVKFPGRSEKALQNRYLYNIKQSAERKGARAQSPKRRTRAHRIKGKSHPDDSSTDSEEEASSSGGSGSESEAASAACESPNVKRRRRASPNLGANRSAEPVGFFAARSSPATKMRKFAPARSPQSDFEDDPAERGPRPGSSAGAGVPSVPQSPQQHGKASREAGSSRWDLPAGVDQDDPSAVFLHRFEQFVEHFEREQNQLRTSAYSKITAELAPTGGAVSMELMEKMMTAPARWAKAKAELEQEAERKKKELRDAMVGNIERWYRGGDA